MSTPAITVAFHVYPGFNPAPPPVKRPQHVRRRTTPSQGRALEVLGHAIEYLVDSRMSDTWESKADAEAVHLLMACSRSVFAECERVLSWQQRLGKALQRRSHVTEPSPR